ncbi:oligopeptide/dipeptide ABC transporter ATP-binding protein [Breoghania sp.]|uniref:ABC transporter ATP-binding protein n=1 Tax=Breoghania sp. TaxID=2065378 RepID=UPI0026116E21|nr:oligopeptide/dipeptide ABC transporter ATP-binding protein [Breoghania sp.]MDJ0933120.1 ATP-binding cassette domain-containing protein [Breoghania sp.]
MTTEVILRADDVSKTFLSRTNMLKAPRAVHAVNHVNLEIHHGETFAIVGESGCGKSTLSRLLLDLIALSDGRVVFEDQNIATLRGSAKQAFRRKAQMIFQDPFSSLNPHITVADIIGEPIWLEGHLSRKARLEKVLDLMARVSLRPDKADLYPHEFSGGQRQRIGIARALAGDPKLIISDEPVSALDFSVQAQIINLLEALKHEFGLTLIIVAHDLVVVRHMSDRVAVMYLGQIVEIGPVEALYGAPLHPYTQSLLAAVPVSSPAECHERSAVEGDLPDAANVPTDCSFHPRCPFARDRCLTEESHLRVVGNGHQTACHFY